MAGAGTSESTAGFSFYTRIFSLFDEPNPLAMQMGMGGTWLTPTNISWGSEAMGDTCACDPKVLHPPPHTHTHTHRGHALWFGLRTVDGGWALGVSAGLALGLEGRPGRRVLREVQPVLLPLRDYRGRSA